MICGFEWGIDSRTLREVERRLAIVEPEFRGFAYEGATMAYTVRDAMAGGRGQRVKRTREDDDRCPVNRPHPATLARPAPVGYPSL